VAGVSSGNGVKGLKGRWEKSRLGEERELLKKLERELGRELVRELGRELGRAA